MLAVTIALLAECRHSEKHLYVFLVDRGASAELEPVIDAFPLEKRVVRRSHSYPGNSYNLLEGYKLAESMLSGNAGRLVYMVEEDVFVARDFFLFHMEAHRRFSPFCVSACADQNWRGVSFDRDPEAIYSTGRYQSLGVSFRAGNLRLFTVHGVEEYYRDTTDYVRCRFPGSSFADHLSEQDGIIDRVMEQDGLRAVYPFVPRAFHAGWYGYHHAPDDTPSGKSFRERLGLALDLAYGRNGHAGISPILLGGIFVKRLVEKNVFA